MLEGTQRRYGRLQLKCPYTVKPVRRIRGFGRLGASLRPIVGGLV